ncbi:hypothetical protein P692DRAFT_201725565 [Suillus brevipes Sb2]|jgi:hypothetical protein|nr:hypothetical protein P692DRAFT_201725565 [Suillus brevipes Sb2]
MCRFQVDIGNAFTFEHSTASQLWDIEGFELKDRDLGATDSAKQAASDLLDRAKNRANFSNAGEGENMLGLAIIT